jgi:signal transduction histidine kinase
MEQMTSRVLLIHRSREFLHSSGNALRQIYWLDTAGSDAVGIQKLQHVDYDVVIAQTEPPAKGSQAPELFSWIRQHRPLTVCIALVSPAAARETSAMIAFMRKFAFDYMLDTADPNDLVCRVNRAMDFRNLTLSEKATRGSLDYANRTVEERRATHELVNINNELAAANRAKDQFLAEMSHELRTPLTAITGAVRILRSPRSTKAKAQPILEILDRNVETLQRLLDDVMDCSRIASGKLNVELTPTGISECVRAAVETMRGKAAAANVELYLSLSAESTTVQGSPVRLQQIAWNLIDNAIKFTPAGGRVVVSVSRRREDVELMVCDSGIGLARKDLERIFEPFAQVCESESTKKGGLGLGLALVRNLTEMHRGRVRAESRGVGHGSTFVVSLPLAAERSPVQQAA